MSQSQQHHHHKAPSHSRSLSSASGSSSSPFFRPSPVPKPQNQDQRSFDGAGSSSNGNENLNSGDRDEEKDDDDDEDKYDSGFYVVDRHAEEFGPRLGSDNFNYASSSASASASASHSISNSNSNTGSRAHSAAVSTPGIYDRLLPREHEQDHDVGVDEEDEDGEEGRERGEMLDLGEEGVNVESITPTQSFHNHRWMAPPRVSPPSPLGPGPHNQQQASSSRQPLQPLHPHQQAHGLQHLYQQYQTPHTPPGLGQYSPYAYLTPTGTSQSHYASPSSSFSLLRQQAEFGTATGTATASGSNYTTAASGSGTSGARQGGAGPSAPFGVTSVSSSSPDYNSPPRTSLYSMDSSSYGNIVSQTLGMGTVFGWAGFGGGSGSGRGSGTGSGNGNGNGRGSGSDTRDIDDDSFNLDLTDAFPDPPGMGTNLTTATSGSGAGTIGRRYHYLTRSQSLNNALGGEAGAGAGAGSSGSSGAGGSSGSNNNDLSHNRPQPRAEPLGSSLSFNNLSPYANHLFGAGNMASRSLGNLTLKTGNDMEQHREEQERNADWYPGSVPAFSRSHTFLATPTTQRMLSPIDEGYSSPDRQTFLTPTSTNMLDRDNASMHSFQSQQSLFINRPVNSSKLKRSNSTSTIASVTSLPLPRPSPTTPITPYDPSPPGSFVNPLYQSQRNKGRSFSTLPIIPGSPRVSQNVPEPGEYAHSLHGHVHGHGLPHPFGHNHNQGVPPLTLAYPPPALVTGHSVSSRGAGLGAGGSETLVGTSPVSPYYHTATEIDRADLESRFPRVAAPPSLHTRTPSMDSMTGSVQTELTYLTAQDSPQFSPTRELQRESRRLSDLVDDLFGEAIERGGAPNGYEGRGITIAGMRVTSPVKLKFSNLMPNGMKKHRMKARTRSLGRAARGGTRWVRYKIRNMSKLSTTSSSSKAYGSAMASQSTLNPNQSTTNTSTNANVNNPTVSTPVKKKVTWAMHEEQPPLPTNASQTAFGPSGSGHPAEALFWAGFTGPWCWLIGGWMLTRNGTTFIEGSDELEQGRYRWRLRRVGILGGSNRSRGTKSKKRKSDPILPMYQTGEASGSVSRSRNLYSGSGGKLWPYGGEDGVEGEMEVRGHEMTRADSGAGNKGTWDRIRAASLETLVSIKNTTVRQPKTSLEKARETTNPNANAKPQLEQRPPTLYFNRDGASAPVQGSNHDLPTTARTAASTTVIPTRTTMPLDRWVWRCRVAAISSGLVILLLLAIAIIALAGAF